MDKAQRYRERAEGLRGIAGDMPDDSTKRMLISISREYDLLAALIETEGDPLSSIAALKKPNDSN